MHKIMDYIKIVRSVEADLRYVEHLCIEARGKVLEKISYTFLRKKIT